MPDNASPTNWVVQGKAVVRSVEWLSDSMNFVGFNLPTNSVPNFQTFFSGSSSHSNELILRLNAQGRWQTTSATTAMRRGEAFWIRCNGRSEFQGPLSITLAQGNGLDYGRVLVEQSVDQEQQYNDEDDPVEENQFGQCARRSNTGLGWTGAVELLEV